MKETNIRPGKTDVLRVGNSYADRSERVCVLKKISFPRAVVALLISPVAPKSCINYPRRFYNVLNERRCVVRAVVLTENVRSTVASSSVKILIMTTIITHKQRDSRAFLQLASIVGYIDIPLVIIRARMLLAFRFFTFFLRFTQRYTTQA